MDFLPSVLMKIQLLLFAFLASTLMMAQITEEQFPYYELPEYPETFSAGTVAARMIDGLGFRYYWATQDLRISDLDYKPNDDVRSTGETIDHILNLSYVIVNSTLKKPNDNNDYSAMDLNDKRKQTLVNLKPQQIF